MIKLLIGGSPCTFWSIAQKNGRETEAEGLGWELFKNFLVAKEKFKPDFFLYENNKSAAQPIKDQISRELGVDLMYINSALVSAQNRQRFYAFNWEVEQPQDRGIVLKDILESGTPWREKAYTIDSCYYKGGGADIDMKYQGCRRLMVAEPVRIPEYGNDDKSRPLNAYYSNNCGGFEHRMFSDNPNKQQVDMIAEPVRVGCMPSPDGTLRNSQAKRVYSTDGKSVNLVANGGGEGAKTGLYAVPIKVGEIGKGGQGNRIYSVDGKSVAQTATSGGIGSNTGLYAVPCEQQYELSDEYFKGGETLIGMTTNGEGKYRNGSQPSQQYRVYSCEGKSQVVNTLGNENYIVPSNGKQTPVYEVKNGFITIKGKKYPIKLADGYYIIRKLTPIECERLQTLPDNYTAAVSNTQRYKGLGNGWTAEVIIHILNGVLKDVPRDEEIVVLSMYDGIGTGRYCLDKMGFTNVKYYAYEIDKYAKQVAMSNYPDIIQMGDAFDLRHPDWTIGY